MIHTINKTGHHMQIKMSEWGRETLNVWNVCFLQTYLVKVDLL